MKFIIFILASLCFTQTLAEAANKEKLQQLGNCKTYTYDDRGLISGCGECHTGFKKVNGNCVFDESKKTYPAHNCNDTGRCDFYDLKFNAQGGVCGDEVDLIDINGDSASDGIQNPSCIACAKFTSNGKCEKCATGYILNGDKCIPLHTGEHSGVDLFDEVTNQNCVHGLVESGSQKCHFCTGHYKWQDMKCIEYKKSDQSPLEYTDGCIRFYFDTDSNLICLQCREGYIHQQNTCKKIEEPNCLTAKLENGAVSCTRCKHGYKFEDSHCVMCELSEMYLSSAYFDGDECSLLSTQDCEVCNPNCKVDQNKKLCFSKHCDLFDSENKCIRCEQGYVFNDERNCIASTECKNYETGFCEDGYYPVKEDNDQIICKKCKGKCTKCLSDEICLEGEKVSSGHALNGLPCFDPNCKLCSSEDPHVCLECNPSVPGEEQIVLKNGRCYLKYHENYYGGSFSAYNACRFYREPSFSTDLNEIITGDLLNKAYVRHYSVAYTHSLNTDGLCEYHDMVPHYFKHDGNNIMCAGKGRDPYNDCECEEGYYSEGLDKFTDCKKYEKDPYCAKPLNENICGKCKEGLSIVTFKENDEVKSECGCPNGFRPDENGVCVQCPKNCRTCRTNSAGEAQCLTCEGYVENDFELFESNNYYRDLTKQCACQEGYVAYEAKESDAEPNRVYACYKIPQDCPEDYIPLELTIKCNSCKGKPGFDPEKDCNECKTGYYKDTGADSKETCLKCPEFDGTDLTPCKTCKKSGDKVKCESCTDDYMDPEQNCQKCFEGYSLKYQKTDDGKSSPFCIECGKHCKSTDGCFYGKQGDTTTNEKGTFTNPYTSGDIVGDEVELFCSECANPGGNIWDKCACPPGSLLVNDTCKSCEQLFKDTNDPTVDGCDLTNGCSSSKKASEIQHYPPYKCLACKQTHALRVAASNCVTCQRGYYPVTPSATNGGCEACPSYCSHCIGQYNCSACAQETTGSNLITGDNCTICIDGYFSDGSKVNVKIDGKDVEVLKCSKCASNCKLCSGTSLNCSVCTDSDHTPSQENGCAQCIPGLYYDPFDGSCKKVDGENQYGFVDSVLVCTNDKGALVDCTSVVNEPNAETAEDERQKYNATERGTKCDTTITGVAPEPVEGLCVCKTGFHDNRTAEEIAASPKPVCLDDRLLTGDDFCVDAIENNDGTYACRKCNADYLEVKNGKCVCKNSHYTTSWGACIPCGRHNKGCKECSGKKQCTKCEDGYSLRDGACHA